MISRIDLERQQLRLYLLALSVGLLIGSLLPALGAVLAWLLWPTLGLLLYATFVQIPLLHIGQAFRDRRFLLASLFGNFVCLPLLVWLLLQLLPDNPALRLGVLLVLVVPCTDWFITFSHLGGGCLARATAITPLNLLLQFLLLPFYLWLMLPAGNGLDSQLDIALSDLLPAALGLLVLPLLLALASERWLEARPQRAALRDQLAWLPVPLLALVLLIIASTQVGMLPEAMPTLLSVLPAFLLFLLGAALLARLLSHCLQLPAASGRTLAFSFGTRNSFLVLPLALALPAGWELTVVVVVFQSLVELFGMLFYLRWIPRRLFP